MPKKGGAAPQRQTQVGVVIGSILLIFVGAYLMGTFEDIMVDMEPGMSTDFNTTVERLITFGWITFTFLTIGLLVIAGRYIIALVQGF